MLAVMIAQMADIVVEPTTSAQHMQSSHPCSLHHQLGIDTRKYKMLTLCEIFEGCKVGSYWDDSHQYCEKDELEQNRSTSSA